MADKVPGRNEKLLPEDFWGHSNLDASDNALGVVFQARTAPAISRDSIIVAVAGPNDFEDSQGLGTSSPIKDGWFHSDMYLYEALCEGTAREQYWFSCVGPEQLVSKYTRFLHGHPKCARKIVLDSEELPRHMNMIVVAPSDLRERFLATINEQLDKIKDSDRQLIIMMFGHGYSDPAMNFGIHIGGAGL